MPFCHFILLVELLLNGFLFAINFRFEMRVKQLLVYYYFMFQLNKM